jgi:hypothetical protein
MSTKEEFIKNYPFISCVKIATLEYIGIIINYDQSILSLYDYFDIKTEEEKQEFLKLGDIWWWESNRKIPINIFLRSDMMPFRCYIKTFNAKDSSLIFGPRINLLEIAEKRVKRKSIQLVKNVKKVS